MDELRALRLVEARLGRGPQDALEAAVVLEAWAGMPARHALETGRALMPLQPRQPVASATLPAGVKRPRGVMLEGATLLVTVLAIASWAGPLSQALGADAVVRALTLALPATLSLQWALRARHLGRPSGLSGLRHRRGALTVAAAALIAVPTALLGTAGALAGLLTVTWVSGSLLLRRGWAAPYAIAIAAATAALATGAPVLWVVGAVAVLVCAAAALALTGGPVLAGTPGRPSRTLGAAVMGAGLGWILVGDPSVAWGESGLAALALLPSAAGGLWASARLWRLAGAFPRALSGVPAGAGTPPWVGAPAATLLGAGGRLLAVTVAGSVALAPWVGAGVLAGFGLVAAAGLLTGLLESLGRPAWAALGILLGVAGELAVRSGEVPFAGAGLVAGGSLALAALLPAAAVLLARPARTLATGLWIT